MLSVKKSVIFLEKKIMTMQQCGTARLSVNEPRLHIHDQIKYYFKVVIMLCH